MDRRRFNLLAGLFLTNLAPPLLAKPVIAFQSKCRALESQLKGRLGVNWLDIATGQHQGYRATERFPMCSTFKWLAAAAILHRVDAGQEQLGRRIVFGPEDLMEWAPVTQHHVNGDGMTIAALCEAAIADSDNTAANLLLNALGGIGEWNRYVRSLGDQVTRLDRREPLLNEAWPGDIRDTTTPAAMLANLRRVLLEDALSPASKTLLTQWMLSTKYSGQRLRYGLSKGWQLADKTGTGNTGSGTANDVGVLWQPSGSPIVVSVYLTQARVSREEQEAAIATVGRWIREDLPHVQ